MPLHKLDHFTALLLEGIDFCFQRTDVSCTKQTVLAITLFVLIIDIMLFKEQAFVYVLGHETAQVDIRCGQLTAARFFSHRDFYGEISSTLSVGMAHIGRVLLLQVTSQIVPLLNIPSCFFTFARGQSLQKKCCDGQAYESGTAALKISAF